MEYERSQRTRWGVEIKTPDSSKPESSAKNKRNVTASGRFTRTENLRQLRVIQVLIRRPLPREQVHAVASASKCLGLVASVRGRGLSVPCTRTKKKDRDSFGCYLGVYYFTSTDHRRVNYWLVHRYV